MSPVDFILGIRDVLIERVERGREIHVWARPTRRSACIHCQQEAVRIKATHQRTLKHTRQGNQLMGLFIINGGQRHSLDLFLRRNAFNGSNADVPSRFYLRNQRFID